MVKQKIVVRVSMEGAKGRCKALKTVAGLYGIISTALEDDRIVVVGDVDSVILTLLLRKKMKFAELVKVEPVDEKKEEKKEGGESKSLQPVVFPSHYYGSMMQPVVVHQDYDPSCSIM